MEKGDRTLRAPKGWLAVQCGVRFAKILTNFSVLCAIVCILTGASFLLVAAVFLFGAVAIIGSLGTVFILIPEFGDKFTGAINNTSQISQMLTDIWPIVAGVGLGCAALAIIIFACIKTEKHNVRIALCSVMAAVILIMIFLLAVVFQV